jgi:hypothetical protein
MKVPAARQGGVVVFPQTADRSNGAFTCLGCENVVYLKRGNVYKAHFAHAPDVACNESIMHLATKEWIASLAKNPGFVIVAECSCGNEHAVVRGHPELIGCTEVSCLDNKYKMDVAFVDKKVFHTHRAGAQKLNEIEGSHGWHLPAVEVGAINLVDNGFPIVFSTLQQRSCTPCVKRRLRLAKAQTLQHRVEFTLRCGLAWLYKTEDHQRRRAKRAWFIWRARVCFKSFLGSVKDHCNKENARIAAAEEVVRQEHARREAERHTACAKCCQPVELYCWEDGRKQWQEYLYINGKTYHSQCNPICAKCNELHAPMCKCERMLRSPCVDCKQSFLKTDLHELRARKYICQSCAIECTGCKSPSLGGKCYTCTVKRKYPDLHYCLGCDTVIDECYTMCHACKYP